MLEDTAPEIVTEAPVGTSTETVPEIVVEDEPLDTSQIPAGHMPRFEEVPEPAKEDSDVKEADTGEVVDETAKDDADEKAEDDGTAKDEAAEEVVEPVIFDATAETPELLAKVTEVLEKYELPPDVQAAFDALRTKAEAIAVPAEVPEIITQLADYGDVDAIKKTLDRNNLVSSVREVDGQYRPNTDKYVAEISTEDPEKASWLYFDLASTPSLKYKGLSKFEEGICDALGTDDDTVGSVLTRYNQAMAYAKNGIPASDVPTFVPPHLYDAYKSLPKETREQMVEWEDPEYDESFYAPERSRKLIELGQIQKGIDADKREAVETRQKEAAKTADFQTQVNTKQVKFYEGMRDAFATNLAKDVIFSTDPKQQNFEAKRHVAICAQAIQDDADGAFARQALEESGIKFDYNKARQLVQSVQDASVALTIAERQVDAQGKQLNAVEFNKATREIETTGRAWQDFYENLIKRTHEFTSTGKAEEVIKAVETAKQKVQLKARPIVKAIGSTEPEKDTLPPVGPARTAYWADKMWEEEQAKVARYST